LSDIGPRAVREPSTARNWKLLLHLAMQCGGKGRGSHAFIAPHQLFPDA
jgi:hypothetical protein